MCIRDSTKVKPFVESKVFGIGVESYTVGSAEFALNYEMCIRDRRKANHQIDPEQEQKAVGPAQDQRRGKDIYHACLLYTSRCV